MLKENDSDKSNNSLTFYTEHFSQSTDKKIIEMKKNAYDTFNNMNEILKLSASCQFYANCANVRVENIEHDSRIRRKINSSFLNVINAISNCLFGIGSLFA